jgi:hypothetical protein
VGDGCVICDSFFVLLTVPARQQQLPLDYYTFSPFQLLKRVCTRLKKTFVDFFMSCQSCTTNLFSYFLAIELPTTRQEDPPCRTVVAARLFSRLSASINFI